MVAGNLIMRALTRINGSVLPPFGGLLHDIVRMKYLKAHGSAELVPFATMLQYAQAGGNVDECVASARKLGYPVDCEYLAPDRAYARINEKNSPLGLTLFTNKWSLFGGTDDPPEKIAGHALVCTVFWKKDDAFYLTVLNSWGPKVGDLGTVDVAWDDIKKHCQNVNFLDVGFIEALLPDHLNGKQELPVAEAQSRWLKAVTSAANSGGVQLYMNVWIKHVPLPDVCKHTGVCRAPMHIPQSKTDPAMTSMGKWGLSILAVVGLFLLVKKK